MHRWLLACLPAVLAACTTMQDGSQTKAPLPPEEAARVPSVVVPAKPADVSVTSTAPQAPANPATPQGPGSSQNTPAGATEPPATPQPDPSATPAKPVENEGAETAIVPADPLRPDVRVNLEDRSARLDLWARVRGGFSMPVLNNEGVRKAEKMYARQPEYVQRMAERGGRYLFHIVEEVQKRGLPTELALLPFVESAFNPEAMSHASASGMWQFMPATGKVFNLKQNVFRDDRRDVLASTKAALDYLQKLHGMFGDWHLALAAYNWGEGSVRRAILRNKARGLPTDYQSLPMPNETRFYLPKLQAIKNIVANPQAFGLNLPLLENHPYFLMVSIDRDIDVELASRLAGMPVADFKALNPQLNRPVILAAGTPQLLMPYDQANTFIQALHAHKGPLASWTTWKVPKAMKSADAAKFSGMTLDAFLAVNQIPPKMIVQAGSTVLVPRSASRQVDVPVQMVDNASLALAHESPPMRKMVVRAGKGGESVAAIAKRYKVTAAQVGLWNQVAATGSFAPGAKVVLQVPVKAKTRMARGSKPARVAKGHKGKQVHVAQRNGKVRR